MPSFLPSACCACLVTHPFFFPYNFMLVVLALPRVELILIVYPGKLIRQWKFHSSTVYVYTHSCQWCSHADFADFPCQVKLPQGIQGACRTYPQRCFGPAAQDQYENPGVQRRRYASCLLDAICREPYSHTEPTAWNIDYRLAAWGPMENS
jgi:hypothetical protein